MKFEEVYKFDIFANEAGVTLKELNDNSSQMYLKVERRHLNGGGFAHGGAIFVLCDMAMAAIANHKRFPSVSIQSDIRFLATAVEGDVLTATAEETYGRKKLSYGRCTVRNQRDEVIAIAEGMFHVKGNFPTEETK